MMRVASVFSKLKRPLAGAVLLLLAGCAGGQAADVKDGAVADDVAAVKSTASVDSFTTVGKPTKVIETPWGAREVYDPAQDGEVLKAIHRLYSRGKTSIREVSRIAGFGDVVSFEKSSSHIGIRTGNDIDIETVKTARRTHYFDVLRLGCKQAVEVPCQYFGSFYFKQQCPIHALGEPDLTSCEQDNWASDYTDIAGPAPIPPAPQNNLKDPYPSYHWTSFVCTIDGIENKIQGSSLIGGTSGYTLGQTERLLTTVECLEWPEKFNNEKGYTK